MDTLERKLNSIKRLGAFPVVKEAPKGAVTFDTMVVVYLDEKHKRLYQVHFYDTKTGKVVGTY
jgi:hypothetical protein